MYSVPKLMPMGRPTSDTSTNTLTAAWYVRLDCKTALFTFYGHYGNLKTCLVNIADEEVPSNGYVYFI
jgi:hypothetical protein